MLPLLSSSRPCGPEWGVLSGNSLNVPVFGSRRPSTLVICPVYQSAPSRVASGSCGRDPGVGTCHSLIETRAGPGITMPTGFRSEEHTSELQSRFDLGRRLLIEQ